MYFVTCFQCQLSDTTNTQYVEDVNTTMYVHE